MNLMVGGSDPSFLNALVSRPFQGEGKFGTKGGSSCQCIPKAPQNPKFIIPTRCLEHNRKHIRYHAFICKFIGIWSTEKELECWI